MNIFITDSTEIAHPEGIAVLQALASRSTKSIKEQIPTVTQDRSEKFISKHVIGYNHSSVLDAAQTVVSFEGISMLAAKAVEDNPLFVGTECSTRYIDFSEQRFYNPMPIEDTEGASLLDKLRKFYKKALSLQIEFFKKEFPQQEGQNETVWHNAIKAKAFDVVRCLLPAGATTTVHFVGRLRDLNEQLAIMRFHPLNEISNMAYQAIGELNVRYPASCPLNQMSDETKAFIKANQIDYFYIGYKGLNTHLTMLDQWEAGSTDREFSIFYDDLSLDNMNAYFLNFKDRPRGTPIPRIPGGESVHIHHEIDYGSFRDIQRQRNCIQKLPLLGINLGFEIWYRRELVPEIDDLLDDLMNELEDYIVDLDVFNAQYFIPMGYKVENVITSTIPQLVYMAELRSSKYVHPTARFAGLSMADFLEDNVPNIKIYPDRDESAFNIGRGRHTISEKASE